MLVSIGLEVGATALFMGVVVPFSGRGERVIIGLFVAAPTDTLSTSSFAAAFRAPRWRKPGAGYTRKSVYVTGTGMNAARRSRRHRAALRPDGARDRLG